MHGKDCGIILFNFFFSLSFPQFSHFMSYPFTKCVSNLSKKCKNKSQNHSSPPNTAHPALNPLLQKLIVKPKSYQIQFPKLTSLSRLPVPQLYQGAESETADRLDSLPRCRVGAGAESGAAALGAGYFYIILTAYSALEQFISKLLVY